MIKNQKTILSFLILSLLFAFGGICYAEQTVGGMIQAIVAIVTPVVGFASTIMFIYAGSLYLASTGSPDLRKKANVALTFAVIGTIIAGSASGLVGDAVDLFK